MKNERAHAAGTVVLNVVGNRLDRRLDSHPVGGADLEQRSVSIGARFRAVCRVELAVTEPPGTVPDQQ